MNTNEPVSKLAVGTAKTTSSAAFIDRVGAVFGRSEGVERAVRSELIATLNEVADAVSSAIGIEETLRIIVERAKRITNTDKAVLVLTDEHSGHVDLDTIVVRGRRDQHAQSWWESRLDALGERAFAADEPILEDHPADDAWLLCGPVRVQDHPIGLLCAINTHSHPFTPDQIGFIAVLSAFAASAIENARLAEQGRYVLLASERDRIAREMHDGVVQSLFSISLGLELCKKQVMRDPAGVAVRLDELQRHLNTSMTELRRFIYDLRPMKLAELGLVGAIDYWVSEVTADRHVRGRVVVEGSPHRLTPSEEACLYRVAKEAVSNAVKHSNAEWVIVRIDASQPGVIGLTVSDDGDGFDADAVMEHETKGLGLSSIKERVRRDAGSVVVDSEPGRGTIIRVSLPVGGAV